MLSFGGTFDLVQLKGSTLKVSEHSVHCDGPVHWRVLRAGEIHMVCDLPWKPRDPAVQLDALCTCVQFPATSLSAGMRSIRWSSVFFSQGWKWIPGDKSSSSTTNRWPSYQPWFLNTIESNLSSSWRSDHIFCRKLLPWKHFSMISLNLEIIIVLCQ